MKRYGKLLANLVSVFLILSVITPTQANAADPCIPDTIDVKAFAVHAGQKSGFLVNGAPLSRSCAMDDPGVLQIIYGPRVGNSYKTGLIESAKKSWKWKDFSYEDLVDLLKQAQISEPIDAQSLFVLSFYRISNGAATVDAAGNVLNLDGTKNINFGIVLDPTKAGPCHPDNVALTARAADVGSILPVVKKGVDSPQFLNGVVTTTACAEKDPGWLFVGYAPSASDATFASEYFVYQPDWYWGGVFNYEWVMSVLAMATPPVTGDVQDGSLMQWRFYRGGSPAVQPKIDEYTFLFAASLDPKPAPVATTTDTKTSKSKSITIKCVKGKTTKKVSGTNPKCPAGYKKK